MMRTSLTIDDDAAVLLEQVQRQRKASLKEVVNTVLRQGLAGMQGKPKPRAPFRTQHPDLGQCYVPNSDNIAKVLAIAEGEDYR
jgi:hypothetical protein